MPPGYRGQGGIPALQHRQEGLPRRQDRRHAALPRHHQHTHRLQPLLTQGRQGGAGDTV